MEIMNENFCHLLSAININYLYEEIWWRAAASDHRRVDKDIKLELRGEGR